MQKHPWGVEDDASRAFIQESGVQYTMDFSECYTGLPILLQVRQVAPIHKLARLTQASRLPAPSPAKFQPRSISNPRYLVPQLSAFSTE